MTPGTVKITDRDIAGLTLYADQYGAPHDLLAAALNVREERLRGIIARWRHAGWTETSVLGKGPAWVWLTPAGAVNNHASGGGLGLRDGLITLMVLAPPAAAVVPPGSRADQPCRLKREDRALDPARPARYPAGGTTATGWIQGRPALHWRAIHERQDNAHR